MLGFVEEVIKKLTGGSSVHSLSAGFSEEQLCNNVLLMYSAKIHLN